MASAGPPRGRPDTSFGGFGHSQRATRAAANRLALVRAARAQFGAHGYQRTKTTRIAAAAGLTLGALYHHFPGKPALFLTVLDEIEAEVFGAVGEAMTQGAAEDSLDGLCNAVACWVSSYQDPATRQILLVDRPTVLGPGYEENHRGVCFVTAALQECTNGGVGLPRTTLHAHLIVSAVEGAGRYIGGAADAERASREITAELQQFVRSSVAAAQR